MLAGLAGAAVPIWRYAGTSTPAAMVANPTSSAAIKITRSQAPVGRLPA